MAAPVTVTLADKDSPLWSEDVASLRTMLGAPDNTSLFPHHYLASTFPKIGGQIALFRHEGRVCAVAFLFPRGVQEGRRIYTLRFHSADLACGDEHARRLLSALGGLLGGARVVFYDPTKPHHFERTGQPLPSGLDLGTPDLDEARAVRRAQEAIWGAEPDDLYPTDLHSVGFGAGTTLVARQGHAIVGFLFGFYRFQGSALPPAWDARYHGHLRLESQLLGVVPGVRKQGVGFLLKRAQAEDARAQGIGIVNWTVDPLQLSNAVLNFGRLKAVAFDIYPAHYTFRNDLNQVAASRFGVTWLVASRRVREALEEATGATIVALAGDEAIPRVNRGAEQLELGASAPTIAIEIPANWTAVQREDYALAHRWRTVTDRLFAHYLGHELGQYAVTGVGQDGEARYLLAERLTPEFLDRYGA